MILLRRIIPYAIDYRDVGDDSGVGSAVGIIAAINYIAIVDDPGVTITGVIAHSPDCDDIFGAF